VKKQSVVVGMSGGVDSAVVAALLCEAGFDVIGVTLVIWKDDGEEEKRWQDRSCCKVGLARHVAKQLGIPHHTVDVQAAFQKEVIDNFCDTYLLGQTPNPCVLCNARIKFAELLSVANKMGADFLATGHYARVASAHPHGFILQKGIDREKDQSYFLYRLSQEQLAKTLFPLGEMKKERVYQKAAALKLPYEEVLESQEICFVNQKDYRDVLTEYRPHAVAPGNIVTESGEVVGSHKGIAFHTVGQRRGLGVSLGERAYVTRIDRVKNEVVIGEATDLLQRELIADQVVWGADGACPSAVAGATVGVKIRYRSAEKAATLTKASHHSFALLFDEPVSGISPGQSVVLYQGDSVMGGGMIRNAGGLCNIGH
jgi:tRNA-specific 2-thiouridylase